MPLPTPNPPNGNGRPPTRPASCSAKPPSTACLPKQADWIGAFDPAGNCAGAAPIIVNEGLAYFNLPIYGDDAGTTDLDEGITAGEPFTLRIWQAASNSFATYPNDDAPEYLDGWSNTNGAPISDYSDPSVVYDFALEVNLFIVCPEATCEGGPVQTLECRPAASSLAPA